MPAPIHDLTPTWDKAITMFCRVASITGLKPSSIRKLLQAQRRMRRFSNITSAKEPVWHLADRQQRIQHLWLLRPGRYLLFKKGKLRKGCREVISSQIIGYFAHSPSLLSCNHFSGMENKPTGQVGNALSSRIQQMLK